MHLNMAFTFSLQKKRVSKHLIINVLKLFKIIIPLTLPSHTESSDSIQRRIPLAILS